MKAKCSRCRTTLSPVFENHNRRSRDFPQYKNALAMRIEGQFGMKIDENKEFVYCSSCADDVLKFLQDDVQLFKGSIVG